MDKKTSTKKLATAAAVIPGQEGPEDRISMLPDEIIHQILSGLRSPIQVAQFNILSKKWPRVIQSYPILEFYDDNYHRRPEESQRRLAKAILEKFSHRGTVESVVAIRIKITFYGDFYSGFHARILDLASNFPLLREIDIKFGKYCVSHLYGIRPAYEDMPTEYRHGIPKSFLLTPNGKRFAHLDTLKLQDCSFCLYKNTTNFACVASSLKVLSLQNVDGLIDVHGIIDHAASNLETLSLKNMSDELGKKLQIRNHPNLKVLELADLYLDLLQIGGLDSLEQVRVTNICMKKFKIWSTPNLKVVYSKGVHGPGLTALNEFISTQLKKTTS